MDSTSLPYLTAGLPGIGGTLRAEPEDFQVDEVPLYLPGGTGEHLYLRVTKRNLSTPDLVTRMASCWGVKALAIGVAGRKDARAVTTQMVSVQGLDAEAVAKLPIDECVLRVEVLGYHRNRLRTGHHAGNRFRLVIRDVHPSASSVVPLVLDELTRRGLPNYFGPQRQGRGGQNYAIGAALLTDAGRRARMSRAKRLWYLHAYQSFLFNQMVARRITWLDRIAEGDWAIKHANGACFQVVEAAAEQPRVESWEISPTGLLFGSRAPWASGEPGAIERATAAAHGGTPETLRAAAAACGFRGERRPLRVRLSQVEWTLRGGELTLVFTLPPGAYATVVARELLKLDTVA